MLAIRRLSLVQFPHGADTHVKLTGLGNGLLGIGVDSGGLVALRVQELVVDDLDGAVVGGKQSNLIGNGLSIGEGGDILADLREAENDVLGVGTAELGLDLLSEDDEIGIGVLRQHTTSGFAETGVNTTTETFVGAGDDVKGLLVAFFGLCFGRLEDGVRSGSVDT